MSPTPGILYVTMRPQPSLSLPTFHDWYNNEHGPARLRLPHIFTNGFRYATKDDSGQKPQVFMAVYDVKDMSLLTTEAYTTLRENRSPREAQTIAQLDVERYFYDLVHEKKALSFKAIEGLDDSEADGIETVAVDITVNDTDGAAEAYQKWFINEHVGLLAKVPGWLRSRLFKTSSIESTGKTIFLCLHDYTKDNGLGGEAHNASMETPWRTSVFDQYVASKGRTTYSLFYTFGPAPQDLHSLSLLPETAGFASADKKTATTPGANPVIASYITTKDGLSIPFRLEGNPSPQAPTIAFTNSLLTSLEMWDPILKILQYQRPDLRILRYDTRGRHAIPQPPVAASLTTLTNDLVTLLDTLRISKLDTLIGVSLGGVTTLNFALEHRFRLGKYIACDFNCSSSPTNTNAWKSRIAMAENAGEKGMEKLADDTVSRWLHPASMEYPDVVQWITSMVAANDRDGFRHSCTALWDYDLEPHMGRCTVPGLLVAGDGDAKGVLVNAMDRFSSLIGEHGAQFKVVPNAGHLPMCEEPEQFWEAIREFL